ncbi:hypothetical protein HOU95_gp044 [Streptomyces phage Hiyaa]|uniref:Uncharacterized protein n=1 Tax=Streptomyces phage Hiyaa TaxID=2499072 RepID=A0A3S9U939_9CAUD|nr:hypothetical protein HOU95_gp044 [Streptomyces phage Hiyaa]AZS06763.1 hypothetical protein SEA_HIYAA_124 [Streptomyces phage Hiyaa]
MSWEELPQEARDAITERFPGLAGPSGAGVLWKAAGDPTTSFTGFEGGRLIAVVSIVNPLP